MPKNSQNHETQEEVNYPVETAKVVAEMPGDKEIQDNLQETKENDGYPDSWGGL